MEEGGRSDHGCPLQEEAVRRGSLSRPKPGLSALQPHESGCWVYFLVSAKFIFSFPCKVVSCLLPKAKEFTFLLVPLVPGWLNVRTLAGSGTSDQIGAGV